MSYQVVQKDETLEITTNKGELILADSGLLSSLTQCKWNIPVTQGTPYGKYNGKTITMRKLVYFLKTNIWVTRDSGNCLVHINGNQLDCRFNNLQLVPKGEVLTKPRMKVQKRSKSGYPGVVWNNQTNKWWVYAYKNKKQKYLGCRVDLEEAIQLRKDYLGVK